MVILNAKQDFKGTPQVLQRQVFSFWLATLQLIHQQKRKGNKIQEFQLTITLKSTS